MSGQGYMAGRKPDLSAIDAAVKIASAVGAERMTHSGREITGQQAASASDLFEKYVSDHRDALAALELLSAARQWLGDQIAARWADLGELGFEIPDGMEEGST